MVGLWHCMDVIVRLGKIKDLNMWSFVRLWGYLFLERFCLKFYILLKVSFVAEPPRLCKEGR